MKILNVDTNCCGTGCFEVTIKFEGSEMRDLNVSYTRVDKMSHGELLNLIPILMSKLGYGAESVAEQVLLNKTPNSEL